MQAYLVRLNEEQDHPRELVGFYVAESIPQLYDMIDECCDVDRVEITELGPGGIYWDTAVDYVVPRPETDDEEEPPSFPPKPRVCEWWTDALDDQDPGRWEGTDVAEWSPELDQLYTQLKKFEVAP